MLEKGDLVRLRNNKGELLGYGSVVAAVSHVDGITNYDVLSNELHYLIPDTNLELFLHYDGNRKTSWELLKHIYIPEIKDED